VVAGKLLELEAYPALQLQVQEADETSWMPLCLGYEQGVVEYKVNLWLKNIGLGELNLTPHHLVFTLGSVSFFAFRAKEKEKSRNLSEARFLRRRLDWWDRE
jgi:hypothetical protein